MDWCSPKDKMCDISDKSVREYQTEFHMRGTACRALIEISQYLGLESCACTTNDCPRAELIRVVVGFSDGGVGYAVTLKVDHLPAHVR